MIPQPCAPFNRDATEVEINRIGIEDSLAEGVRFSYCICQHVGGLVQWFASVGVHLDETCGAVRQRPLVHDFDYARDKESFRMAVKPRWKISTLHVLEQAHATEAVSEYRYVFIRWGVLQSHTECGEFRPERRFRSEHSRPAGRHSVVKGDISCPHRPVTFQGAVSRHDDSRVQVRRTNLPEGRLAGARPRQVQRAHSVR